MKKWLVSAVCYSAAFVFPHHHREVIPAEGKGSIPLWSPALQPRTVRDYPGGLLDEEPFQCAACEDGFKKQHQDYLQGGDVYNFDGPSAPNLFSSAVPWMKGILKE